MPSLEAVYQQLNSSNPVSGKVSTGMIHSNINDASQSIANVMYAIGYSLSEAEAVAAMQRSVAFDIKRRFQFKMNALAAGAPRAFWHMYEPNHVGQTGYRLFDLTTRGTQYKSVMAMDITFRPSNMLTPLAPPDGNGKTTKNRHKFPYKATVFEFGQTIHITPKNGTYLVFRGNKGTVFMGGPGRPVPHITINTRKQQTFGALTKAANAFFQMEAKNVASNAYKRHLKKAGDAGRLAAKRKVHVAVPNVSLAKAVGKEASRVVLK